MRIISENSSIKVRIKIHNWTPKNEVCLESFVFRDGTWDDIFNKVCKNKSIDSEIEKSEMVI